MFDDGLCERVLGVRLVSRGGDVDEEGLVQNRFSGYD